MLYKLLTHQGLILLPGNKRKKKIFFSELDVGHTIPVYQMITHLVDKINC